jgi:PAS domain S-box-containing protein
MSAVYEVLDQNVGFKKKLFINIDRRMRRIPTVETQSSNVPDIRSLCEITFFKVEESIVGIQFKIIDDTTDLKNLDMLKLNVLNSVSTGAFVLHDGNILDTNLQFIQMLGYTDMNDVIGHKIENFVYSPDLGELLKNFEYAEQNSPEFKPEMVIRFKKKEGEIIWQDLTFGIHKADDKAEPVVYVNSVDVTDKKKTEIALIRSHRLASIGDLTSGIAHEINNPLFALLNYSSLIKDSVDAGVNITRNSEEYEFIEGIIQEANRISKIIGDFSEFSKMGEETKVVQTDLNDLITKVEKLLAYNIRHSGVTIIKEIEDKFPQLYLPQYRLQHIMFNIILNSIQSLSSKYSDDKKSFDGKLIIKISAEVQKLENSKNLILKFFDNGEGIPDENLVKIFEPFFTTRRNKLGTGLGLNQVYTIVQDLNGSITVDSVFGDWTEFKISIPVKEPF